MEDFYKFLRDFGFPVAVSAYLLVRMEKVLQELVNKITDVIVKLDVILSKRK